jgi:hypothetical protein
MSIAAWVVPGRLCVKEGQYALVMLMDKVIKKSTVPQIDQTYPLVCVSGSVAKAVMFWSDFGLYDEEEWYVGEGEVYCAKIAACENFGSTYY